MLVDAFFMAEVDSARKRRKVHFSDISKHTADSAIDMVLLSEVSWPKIR